MLMNGVGRRLLTALTLALLCGCTRTPLPRLVLATTTSTQDCGLLDYLLPDFEAQYGVKVDVIAVGSGQALALGRDGNADVLLVHSPDDEAQFMANGHGTRRETVMYNDFVILGPQADPAGIKGLSAVKAFAQIAQARVTFISRGDQSGTHSKEKAIWKAAGIEPSGDWYVSAGQGMGAVLTMAEEQQAYTLSDRATYLTRTSGRISLQMLVEGDPFLLNPYSVIAVNPAQSARINATLAEQFVDWLISPPTQEKIARFGTDKFAIPLFYPRLREEQGGQLPPRGIKTNAAHTRSLCTASDKTRSRKYVFEIRPDRTFTH